MSAIKNVKETPEYYQGYTDGYKEGLIKGLELYLDELKLMTQTSLTVTLDDVKIDPELIRKDAGKRLI